jgi:transcriptional regulator with GAF, ATPase, and Fis domain
MEVADLQDDDASSLDEQSGPFGGTAREFGEIARALSSEPTVQATLQRIVDVAVETIEGCDGAGVLLLHRNEIVAGSWSSDVIRNVETMEYQLGEGPCVDAISQAPVFESADLRDNLSQWPGFAARALEAGIESMLGFRLFAAEDTLGALDLYGFSRNAFDETTRAIGTVLASHAAMALAGAQVHSHDLETINGLRDALVARDVIGQAKGILMTRHGIDADAAFALLARTSQDQNVKVRVLAERVAATGELPTRETP